MSVFDDDQVNNSSASVNSLKITIYQKTLSNADNVYAIRTSTWIYNHLTIYTVIN